MSTVELPWPKPPLTGNRTRGNPHARGREVHDTLAAARWAIRAAKPNPLETAAEVALHFRPADKRRRDADGMYPTLKACLDALVAENVLPDDSWRHVRRAVCEIHPPFVGDAAMWLEIKEVA